jgi:hypothetical protein
MKKTLIFSFIILSYNILLLIIPLLIFLASLNSTPQALVNTILFIYSPFVLLSPFLTIVLGYHAAKVNVTPIGWLIPIIISLIGFSPFIFLFFLLSSLWSPFDYLLVIALPILLGLLTNFVAFINNFLHLF